MVAKARVRPRQPAPFAPVVHAQQCSQLHSKLRINCLLIGSWLALAPCSSGAQHLPSHLRLPILVGGFQLSDSAALGGELGSRFRYVDSAGRGADVYLYPVPGPGAESDSVRLNQEASAFLLGLSAGTQADWYPEHQVVVDTLREVLTETGAVPFRLIVFLFSADGEPFVSLAHLFVVDGSFLKVRVTLSGAEWERSPAPGFALDLVKALHRTEGAREPRHERADAPSNRRASLRLVMSASMDALVPAPGDERKSIGRWVVRCPHGPGSTPFQTVRAGFPDTACQWCSRVQHARLRVSDRATQPVQAMAPEPVPAPRPPPRRGGSALEAAP